MVELTPLKVLLVVGLVVVVSLLSLGIYLALKIWPIGADVPLLNTPAWRLRDLNEYTQELMLRRETQEGGSLLIKRSDLEMVYQYDPQKRSLNPVGDAEWQKASGPIKKCFDYRAPLPAPDIVVTRNEQKHQLLIGKPGALREVPTAGGYALQDEISPSGRWVAVRSGTGPAIPTIMPFGADIIWGQRYHEVLSLPDARQVSKPIRFPVRSTTDFFKTCWSPDEEFVVHIHWQFTYLVIVPTGVSSR